MPAVVVIDENSGIIVMGANVRISTVAIAQGNLTITVTETPQVTQPLPFSGGQTVVDDRAPTSRSTTRPNAASASSAPMSPLRELVDGLNALGIGPRDMISILQAIKASGALQAEIEVM